MNDFDRLVYTVVRHRSAMPDLYRALIENDLFALIPFDQETEMIGGFAVENGSPFPFVRLTEKDGRVVVPIFTSEERVDECLKRSKVPPKAYSIAGAPGRQLMEILGAMNLHAVINKNSRKTGEITIPPDLMRDLASGKALEPLGTGGDRPTEKRALDILNAADYPTDLVQPMFEVLRMHRNFRAAWIFGVPGTGPGTEVARRYGVLVLMDPRDAVIFHDFNMVVAAAENAANKVELAFANEGDPVEIAHLFKQAPPFFVAADFGEPPTTPE